MISLQQQLKQFQQQFPDALQAPPVADAPPKCPTCGDLGVVSHKVPVEHADFGKLFPCPDPNCPAAREQQQQRYAGMLQHSGLGKTYAGLTFDSFMRLPAALRAGKELAMACAYLFATTDGFSLDEAASVVDAAPSGHAEQRGWLVLQGVLGVGKTGLAAAAMNEMLARGRAPLYYRLGELVGDVQDGYQKNAAKSATQILRAIQTAPALILDEMNVDEPKASNDKRRIIEELIRYRHGRGLPTLITCNIDAKAFEVMWGARTADVVLEQAHWQIVRGKRLRRGAEIQESF